MVHEATGQHMNFQKKNFRYTTKPLNQFLDEIAEGSQQYLRSLSSQSPTERPADFVSDFPELAADFSLPPQFETVSRNVHSSPLRISGPVTMWLHYDVSPTAKFLEGFQVLPCLFPQALQPWFQCFAASCLSAMRSPLLFSLLPAPRHAA